MRVKRLKINSYHVYTYVYKCRCIVTFSLYWSMQKHKHLFWIYYLHSCTHWRNNSLKKMYEVRLYKKISQKYVSGKMINEISAIEIFDAMAAFHHSSHIIYEESKSGKKKTWIHPKEKSRIIHLASSPSLSNIPLPECLVLNKIQEENDTLKAEPVSRNFPVIFIFSNGVRRHVLQKGWKGPLRRP